MKNPKFQKVIETFQIEQFYLLIKSEQVEVRKIDCWVYETQYYWELWFGGNPDNPQPTQNPVKMKRGVNQLYPEGAKINGFQFVGNLFAGAVHSMGYLLSNWVR